jgi:predicted dehydrogenase
VKSALETGAVGPLRAVFMRLGGKGSHRAWKHQSENGGGTVNEMMSHLLDLLLWFLGDVGAIEEVNLDNLIKCRHIDGCNVASQAEDFALVIGKSAAGVKFIVTSDLISQAYHNDIKIIGEEGYLNFSILDSQESYLFLNRDNAPYHKGKNLLANEKVDLFGLMFADFFQKIQEQRALEKNTFAEAVKLAQLINNIKIKGEQNHS